MSRLSIATFAAAAALAWSTLVATAWANEGPVLAAAPINPHDTVSLQRGARTFVNYCLNCHSAQYMRYSKLQDIGIPADAIKHNMMFASDKIGDTMGIALDPKDGKAWFGAAPPDLSVIARSRGADWLYAYLRGFYRDDAKPTGWNNTVFKDVGMPHVLYELQGVQVQKPAVEAKAEGKAGDKEGGEAHAAAHAEPELVLDKPGRLSPREYDLMVADLVNFLEYMGEPVRLERTRLGTIVLLLLAPLFLLVLWLKKEFWKDVH